MLMVEKRETLSSYFVSPDKKKDILEYSLIQGKLQAQYEFYADSVDKSPLLLYFPKFVSLGPGFYQTSLKWDHMSDACRGGIS